MKKWHKITGGVIGVFVIGFGSFLALHWDSVQILTGTQDLGVEPEAIPQVVQTAVKLRDKGETDWPCWRGTLGDARSPVTGIIKDWSAGLKQVWEVDFLCQGQASATWAAPVIQGDRLIACGRDDTNDLIFCINTTDGSLLWTGHYPAKTDSSHGTGMRATPTMDGDRVYTLGRAGDLVCWNLINGQIQWHKNVSDQGGQAPKWGHSSSPLVYHDLVIVQGGGTARIIAYHKMSGEVAWTSGQGDAGYAPVISTSLNNTPTLIAFHGHGLAALAPDTGTELWNVPWETSFGVNATTPVVHDDKVLITSGYGTGVQLLQVSDTDANPVWTNKVMASHHSDPYILDGYVYGYSGQSMQNKGEFKCMDLATGQAQWTTDAMGWGTCVAVDGYLMCLDIKGNLFLMKPDPRQFIQVTALPNALGHVQGPVWTLPVIANGQLYLRFKQRLVCFSLSPKPSLMVS